MFGALCLATVYILIYRNHQVQNNGKQICRAELGAKKIEIWRMTNQLSLLHSCGVEVRIQWNWMEFHGTVALVLDGIKLVLMAEVSPTC